MKSVAKRDVRVIYRVVGGNLSYELREIYAKPHRLFLVLRYAALTGFDQRAIPPAGKLFIENKTLLARARHLHIERNPRRVHACRESRNTAGFADKSSSN